MQREVHRGGQGHMMEYYHVVTTEDDSDRFRVLRMEEWWHR